MIYNFLTLSNKVKGIPIDLGEMTPPCFTPISIVKYSDLCLLLVAVGEQYSM